MGLTVPCELCLVPIGTESSPGFIYSHRPGIQAWVSRMAVSPSPYLFHADGDARGMPLESTGSPLSQIALVSTMYFKSRWQKKFSFMDTQMLPFTTAEGSTLKVPTMHHTAEVNYGNCPRSKFALLYNMEQVYLFNFHSYHTKSVIFPAWRSLTRNPIIQREHMGDRIDCL